ncbi:hypothetical protein [Aerococcus mictus]
MYNAITYDSCGRPMEPKSLKHEVIAHDFKGNPIYLDGTDIYWDFDGDYVRSDGKDLYQYLGQDKEAFYDLIFNALAEQYSLLPPVDIYRELVGDSYA